MAQVKVYGADWCGPTRRTLSHLDDLGVEYEYIDVDHDSAAAEWVKRQNNGKEKKPTLEVAGTVLSEPDDEELDEALRQAKLLPA
ncbi:MAG: glutaredoxin family protein [Bryobacteraceae bacterium]|nr:glutaredoxin family protein [Bryobacteraceae bacterium]